MALDREEMAAAPVESEEDRKQRLLRSAGSMDSGSMAAVPTLAGASRFSKPSATSQSETPPSPLTAATGQPKESPSTPSMAPAPTLPQPRSQPFAAPSSMLAAPTGTPQPSGKDYSGALAPPNPSPTMAAAPTTSPAEKAYEDLAAQPRPELHGWKKALDVFGQVSPLGRLIEQNIPGSPQFYDAALQRAAGKVTQGQGITTGRQGIEKSAAAAQFDTPEKREAYMNAHPEEFADLSKPERHDYALTGKWPTREPTPKENVGTTPQEVTLHDLMTGENGKPRMNPDTNQPYTYLDAYQKVANVGTGAKTPALAPEKIQQRNAQMTDLYQGLNPGKPLPKEFTLSPNATEKDYADAESALKSLEQAATTDAQREQVQTMREQTQELARQAASDREEKQGLKWVSGTDEHGNVVAVPLSEAKKEGLKNLAEIPTEQVRNIQDARGVTTLLNKNGNEKKPETMGILQLIDSLDKSGQLGIAVSRMNAWLAGTVGMSPGDDPRIITLMNKGQLAMTLSMKAHFGASGGRSPQMLEHFLSMANAKKMDATTLRAGFKAVGDYMGDRAMEPTKAESGFKVF